MTAAPTRLPTVAGVETASPSVAHACPVASSSHDSLGDLAALALAGDLWDVRIGTSCHKDREKRRWLVSGQTRRRGIHVHALSLEAAIARLVEMAESDAELQRLVDDTEPVLSAAGDTRESEAAE